MHSLVAHKDYRYIFMTIPLMLIIAASVITLFVEQSGPSLKKSRPVLLAALLMITISVLGVLNMLPGEGVVYPFTPIFRSEDHKLALLYLSKQSDVAGICVQSSACKWWESGGYYYLHKNVPMYFTKDLGQTGQLVWFFSHWLCTVIEAENKGFRRVTAIGTALILQRVGADGGPAQLRTPPPYTTDIYQPGIDRRYKPNVQPFLH